jgi:hypothetical protein
MRMTAHEQRYPTIQGPGIAVSTVARLYDVMERRAE